MCPSFARFEPCARQYVPANGMTFLSALAAPPGPSSQAFVDHYYRTFDENRQNLTPLYQEQSLLTFQGERFQGAQAILQKLTSLAFQRCQHQLSSVDAQPSLSGGINVFVTGHLLVRSRAGAHRSYAAAGRRAPRLCQAARA